jgi:predicted transcriptional regulator
MSKPRKVKSAPADQVSLMGGESSSDVARLTEELRLQKLESAATIESLQADVQVEKDRADELDGEVDRLRDEIKELNDAAKDAIGESDYEAVAIAMWNEVALGENFHVQSYEVKEKHYAMAKAAITFRYP